MNPSGQGGFEKATKDKQMYRTGRLPMAGKGMTEAEIVWAQELSSMEMIWIRTELRRANPDNSDIEAEEAVDEKIGC